MGAVRLIAARCKARRRTVAQTVLGRSPRLHYPGTRWEKSGLDVAYALLE